MKCYVIDDIKEAESLVDASPRKEVSALARAEVMRLVLGGRLEEDDSYDDYDGFTHHEVKRVTTCRLYPQNCVVLGDRVVGYYARSHYFVVGKLTESFVFPEEWAKTKLFYAPRLPRAIEYGEEAENDDEVTFVDVPDGTEVVTGLGKYKNLFEVRFPASLKKVEGHYAFGEADCLDTVRFDGPVESWCALDFESKDSAPCHKGACLLVGGKPLTELDADVERVGKYAFFGVPLTNIRFSDRLKEIAPYAFSKCKELKNAELPDSLLTIGEGAFSECGALSRVRLPKGLTEIAKDAFSFCSSLLTVKLPESVITIGENAFKNSGLTTISFPSSLREIGKMSFCFCNGITSLDLPQGVFSVGAFSFSSCNALKRVSVRGNALRTIGEQAFSYADELEEFNFPEGLEEIGAECFSYAGFKGEIRLPQTLTTLGGAAFSHCEKIISLRLPPLVSRLYSAVDDCHALSELRLPSGIAFVSMDRTYRSVPLTVYYDGTKESWEKKEVYIRVKGQSPVTVKCSDGEIVYKKQMRSV